MYKQKSVSLNGFNKCYSEKLADIVYDNAYEVIIALLNAEYDTFLMTSESNDFNSIVTKGVNNAKHIHPSLKLILVTDNSNDNTDAYDEVFIVQTSEIEDFIFANTSIMVGYLDSELCYSKGLYKRALSLGMPVVNVKDLETRCQ